MSQVSLGAMLPANSVLPPHIYRVKPKKRNFEKLRNTYQETSKSRNGGWDKKAALSKKSTYIPMNADTCPHLCLGITIVVDTVPLSPKQCIN